MEIREFAEKILFATTLEEKLLCPEQLTDRVPGPPPVTPEAPGRPPDLRFKPSGSGQADFPNVHRLEQAHERGRLLHFFANHELLATELMALVLLRFPDAPAAFRRGVLQTLKDEQEHTRLYLRRMRECGVRFGEIPVSGYFWRAVSRMDNPMDYVAGLSLTFEQANLDFCRSFARGFTAVGDRETARLLARIYRDEIAHVAYGLKWFRRWKDPKESDWEAFRRHLKFPLSPERAKGNALNVQGRLAAGFDAAFIAELKVYSQSKGRTPSVFVFNPFAEGCIAQGKSFTPVRHQAVLARDLSNLPQFLCRRDDIVVLERRPSVEFLSTIKDAGFALPEFVELKGQSIDPASDLARRKIGSLRPWAWGPDSMELLEPLFANVTGEQRTASQRFNQSIARLYSKAWSANLLRTVLESRQSGRASASRSSETNLMRENVPVGIWADEPWLCTEQEVGVAVDSVEGVLGAIAAIRQRGHLKVVVKEALGLAGHNALRLWEPELLESQRRWIENVIQRGCQLVVEPWLERGLDFSVQLEMTSRGLSPCGYTGLINDRRGQFQANWAAANHERQLPIKVASYFRDLAGISRGLLCLYHDIFSLLDAELRRADYLGPIGIDAFIYRTPQGDRRLKPIVEINPRYTMGRLTVELMKHACPGSHGLFRLVTGAKLRAEGFDDFATYARFLNERFPLRLEGKPVPRIWEGAVCLNDPAQAQLCLAVFQVSRRLDETIG